MHPANVEKQALALREENEQLRRENNALKADIAFWKSRHHDAVGREEELKKSPADTQARVEYLNRRLYEKKSERFCPSCGLPLKEMSDTEDSTIIETREVRGYQRAMG